MRRAHRHRRWPPRRCWSPRPARRGDGRDPAGVARATRSTASAGSGKRRPRVRHAQAAHDGHGRGAHRRGHGGQRGRHAHHPRRRVPAARPRSTSCPTSSTCCAARCRSSARGPTIQVQVDPVHRAPARPPGGQAGHHRLGAGQRPRVAAVARAHRARPLVRRAPLAGGSTCRSCGAPPDAARRATASTRATTGGWRPVTARTSGCGAAHGRRQALRHRQRRSPQHATRRRRATPTRWRRPSTPRPTATRRRAIDDPGYVPCLAELVERHDVGAVVPLTDLDIEMLAAGARRRARCPALVPDPEIARATYDKYETHQLLERLGLPSPPTRCSRASEPASYPVMVKPRRGSGARSIHLAPRRGARRSSSASTSTSR